MGAVVLRNSLEAGSSANRLCGAWPVPLSAIEQLRSPWSSILDVIDIIEM